MNQSIAGKLAWLLATLFVVYAFCLNTAAVVFSATIKTSLNLSSIQVTFAIGAFIAGFALMQIPAGYLLDKFNAKFVVSSGVLLLALGNILISFSDTLTEFSLANFLQGVGASFSFIAAGILISQWFSVKLFPILFGLTQTISCVFAGIIHYLFVTELKTHTWNDIYRCLFLFGLILLVFILLFLKSPPQDKNNKKVSLKESLGMVCKNSQVWLCSIAAATSFGILLAYAGFWYMSIQQHYQVSLDNAFIISGLIFAGIGIGTPYWGWISNRYQSRKMILHITLVLGTMALLLGIYLPHYYIQSLIIIKTVSFFIGFFLSGSMLFYTVVSELSTDNTRGVALSVLNTAIFITNTIMMFTPLIFITLISTTFFTYLWILPFCTLISVLLVYFVRETFQKEL
ncbi:MAG: MFS transporter [Legionellales bacterium]|nr:MFS transporter [Legionellales bacterium]